MKSIRIHTFGGPEVMQLEDVADPQPQADQVVVRLRAVGINPVETYIRAGVYGPRAMPFTPGSDGAGEVESVGANVKNLKVGQRVYVAFTPQGNSGTYAEKVVCAANSVFALPENISFAQGAALGVPYATAFRGLFQRGGARAGETVLIHGASGGVGIAAVQLARAYGLTVLGTAGTPEGLRLIQEQGAHETFDHTQSGYLSDVLGFNCGHGVDLIVEMLANVNLAQDLGVLAKNGRVVIIGSRGPVEINPRDLMGRDADVRGMTLFNTPDNDLQSIHAALGAGLENGTLRPIIQEEMPLADAARAHEAVMQSGSHGKIVLVP